MEKYEAVIRRFVELQIDHDPGAAAAALVLRLYVHRIPPPTFVTIGRSALEGRDAGR
jgi:hypothetical protein